MADILITAMEDVFPLIDRPDSEKIQSEIALMDGWISTAKQYMGAADPFTLENHSQIVSQLNGIVESVSAFCGEITGMINAVKYNQKLISCADLRSPLQKEGIQNELECVEALLGEMSKKFEQSVELIERVLAIINSFDNYYLDPNFKQHLDSHKNSLVFMRNTSFLSSFMVETHPRQVIVKQTKYDVSLCCLLPKFLHAFEIVEADILTEEQAKQQRENPWTGGNVLEHLTTESASGWTAKDGRAVNNLSIKINSKLHSKNDGSKRDRVMDLKYFFRFSTRYNISGVSSNIWTLSLPFIFITNNCQEPGAWATIAWNNLISEEHRNPVPWETMAVALKFFFRCHTSGCELTDFNLEYFGVTIFGSEFYNNSNPNIITWSQFCKDLLANRKFTIWEYFFKATRFTKEHVSQLWKEKCIIGFMQRQTAVSVLQNSPPGTFLIRFSDSQLGQITIARIYLNNGCLVVDMLEPYKCSDLQGSYTFADHVLNQTTCIQLYDANFAMRWKKDAFETHRTKQDVGVPGYTPRVPG